MGALADNYAAAAGVKIFGGGSSLVAGTGVTLTDFALDYQGFQHISGSKDVPVVATYTGEPSLLQARAVNDETGAVLVDWATFATNPVGGVASGVLPVPAIRGWYKLQVRDGVNHALVSNGTKRFSVGEFVLYWGQSNIANRTSANGPIYPSGGKYIREFGGGSMSGSNFVGGVFRRFGNINDAFPPNTPFSTYSTFTPSGGSTGDGMVYFANLLSEGLNMNVFVLNKAVGGSEISSWTVGGAPGPNKNWVTARAAMIAASGGDFGLSIGQIGETDAGDRTQAYMESNYATVHANMKALNGRNDSNFHFGLSSLGPGSYLGSAEGDFGVMRLAALHYAQNTPGAFLGTGYHDTRTGSDSVHINSEGFGRGERREAKSALAAKGVGSSGAGPRIVSATRSGLDVTFTVAHTGGTALTDGAGGAGAALTGFQFYDAGAGGAAIAATGSAITSSTTIRITLASEPAGELTARYAIMNVPHGTSNNPQTFVAASVVYDNALPFNSTVGCPLQPCGAITVV